MSETIAERIGNRIKALREKKCLSQEDLAKDMNMTRPGISNWENGKSEPSSSQLVALAKVFKVPLDVLVGNSHEILKIVVVDTSVLIKRPLIVDELIQNFNEVIIPDIVISELNYIKDHHISQKQRAWLVMANIDKKIKDKSIKYVVSHKKDGKNDERIVAVAAEMARSSLTDKVYIFSDDIWFGYLVKEQEQDNLELLTFTIYNERFKDASNYGPIKTAKSFSYDPIKTQRFFSLVKSNKLNELKKFSLQGVNINSVDSSSGFTPLIQAVRNKNLDVVQYLSTLSGINLDARDSYKYKFTALLHASQLKNNAFDIFKTLVENGADIDLGSSGNNFGNTPVMVCAWGGFKQGAEYLLEAGACLNQQDSNGFTALTKACIQSHYEIAELLINGTDLNIRSRENKKAIEYIKVNDPLSQQLLKLFKNAEKESE
jgi:transcriptional regulator with XRE-family HTH domain/ankyrin repeat protein